MSCRALGGGGIMLWVALNKSAKSLTGFMMVRMNAQQSSVTISTDDDIRFQHDNVPLHMAASTESRLWGWLLKWPTLSLI